MSHAKIGFLIVILVVSGISFSIIGLAYIATSSSDRQNQGHPKQQNSQNHDNSQQEPRPESYGVVEHFLDSLAGNIDDRPNPESNLTDQDHRNEQDLIAQRIMARWTFGIFIATVASVGIMIIGTILIYVTLKESRNLTKEAIRTTKAANRANEIHLQGLIANQWARIDIGRPKSVSPLKMINDNLCVNFILDMTNPGMGPAIDVYPQYSVVYDIQSGMMDVVEKLKGNGPAMATSLGKTLGAGKTDNLPVNIKIPPEKYNLIFDRTRSDKLRVGILMKAYARASGLINML